MVIDVIASTFEEEFMNEVEEEDSGKGGGMPSVKAIYEGYCEALSLIDSEVMLLGMAAGRIAMVLQADGYVSFESERDARQRQRRGARVPVWPIYPRSKTIGGIRERIVREAVAGGDAPPDVTGVDARFSAELCACALWRASEALQEFAIRLMVEDIAESFDDYGHVSEVVERMQQWLAMEAPAA